MKGEITFPSEIICAIADEVIARLRPILTSIEMKSPQGNDLMGVDELGRYLGGVSKDWIYQRTAGNEIPFVKVGRMIKFKRTDIDQWLSKQSIPAVAPLSGSLPPKQTRDSKSDEARKNHLKSNRLQQCVK